MAEFGWRVGALVYDGAWNSSIATAPDLFQSVNLRLMTQTFSCEVVTPTPEPVVTYSGHKLAGDSYIAPDRHYHLIILAHFWGDFDRVIGRYPQIAPWLRQQYDAGCVIASINSGVLWVAEAGLLSGRRATSYWRHLPELRQRYPDVAWQDSQALVEDGGLYSSNGQNAAMDLTMHLVEKFCGADMASNLVRDITFDSRRTYDLTLFNIAGLRQHRDSGIHRAQDWLDRHYQQKVSFQALADKVGMSKSTFIRRFQRATGDKPTRYLQRLRMEAAKHQLINTDDSIKTISLNVGYQDFGYFSEIFKALTTLNPRQFRTRFRPGHKR